MTQLSILIPAHNEAEYLGACLDALFVSNPVVGSVEVIVIANGCLDATAAIAKDFAAVAEAKEWSLQVIETAEGGKLNALNLGEAAAQGAVLAYLDADVIVGPDLMAQIARVLSEEVPSYASGTPKVSPAQSFVTRAYALFWQTLPFLQEGVPGFGIYAVNRSGRARWAKWPDVISDDTFVRLNFAPSERISFPGTYRWPMVEGFANLVRVRRRQDIGVREIGQYYPELLDNDDPKTPGPNIARRFFSDPVGFAVYALVAVTTRLPVLRSKSRWARGR